MARLTNIRRKAYRQQHYQANKSQALKLQKTNNYYKLNVDSRKQAYKQKYEDKIKYDKHRQYALNAVEIRSALRKHYASNPGSKLLS